MLYSITSKITSSLQNTLMPWLITRCHAIIKAIFNIAGDDTMLDLEDIDWCWADFQAAAYTAAVAGGIAGFVIGSTHGSGALIGAPAGLIGGALGGAACYAISQLTLSTCNTSMPFRSPTEATLECKQTVLKSVERQTCGF